MSFQLWDTDKNEAQTIYNAEELSTSVFNTIQYYIEKNKRLKERNFVLEIEAKDAVRQEFIEEIERLKERLAMSYGEFASQKEKEVYADFRKRHMHDRLTSRANGGKCPYLIPTGTEIGTILYVKCPICGKEEDITDESVW